MANEHSKEKYKSVKIQIDMVRDKSIAATITERDSVRTMFIPRSAISYVSQKAFGSIMTFPVTRYVDIAEWLCKREGI